MRLEFAKADEDLPGSFIVRLPDAAPPIVVDLVWMRRLDDERVIAGASISWQDTAAVHDWKVFVDTLPMIDPST
jgi:hypothetical protein